MRFFALRFWLLLLFFCFHLSPVRAATFVVDSLDDSATGACTEAQNDCTLRGAIAVANVNPDHDTVTFASHVRGTIDLTRGTTEISGLGASALEITSNLDLIGPGAVQLTLQRNSETFFRILRVGSAATVAVRDLTIAGGTAVRSQNFSDGGGVFNQGVMTLDACVIRDNRADNNGGGIRNDGMMTLQNSTISGNRCLGEGGGILTIGAPLPGEPGRLMIINSTISGNTAGFAGGGLSNSAGARSTILHSTFSNNSAPQGGGISTPFSPLVIGHTILQGGERGANLNSSDGSISSLGYNLSSDNSGPTTGERDRINIDPKLGPLQDNGGPTPTHALRPDSSALNAGNSVIATDQRGVARPQGNAPDIGAYEAILLPLFIGDVVIKEGDSGRRNAVFPVRLSAPLRQDITVNYQTINNAGATLGRDFGTDLTDSDGATPGTLTIKAGQTSASIRVPIIGDTIHESTELFYVLFSSPFNALLSRGRASGTIIDDDRAPALSISDATISEGHSGTQSLTFTVSLSAPGGQVIRVNFTTANGIAREGSDYRAQSSVLTFAPGETSKRINILINGDTVIEANETFFVLLSNAANATIARGRGMGTVINDDSSG